MNFCPNLTSKQKPKREAIWDFHSKKRNLVGVSALHHILGAIKCCWNKWNLVLCSDVLSPLSPPLPTSGGLVWTAMLEMSFTGSVHENIFKRWLFNPISLSYVLKLKGCWAYGSFLYVFFEWIFVHIVFYRIYTCALGERTFFLVFTSTWSGQRIQFMGHNLIVIMGATIPSIPDIITEIFQYLVLWGLCWLASTTEIHHLPVLESGSEDQGVSSVGLFRGLSGRISPLALS